jgi:dTDP-4-amino-4,6-dideoxygalactose transaminase
MIPFNKPTTVGGEAEAFAAVLARGKLCGDGPEGRACETMLEKGLGAPRVLLTTSCTHALEMSALLLDVTPGDEVIVPSFTFVSTANAFVLRGARIVFADVRADTMNLDEAKLEALVTRKTKAIVPVHYAGVGCEMDAIAEVARRAGAAIVEDNAHGLFASWRGKNLGTFGALATQSFHETKNFSAGEGGALVINDPALADRAEVLREKGTNRRQFFRGQVDKYTWVDEGSSWIVSDLLAAMLRLQLEQRERVQGARERIWRRYATELGDWAERAGARLPVVPAYAEQSFHMFYVVFESLARRTAFIEHLKSKEVQASFHYVPLHRSPMGLKHGGAEASCPVTDAIADGLVRLPFFTNMTDDEQSRALEAIRSFR